MSVQILDQTTKNPISLIGEMAGICWGSDISDTKKNYARGMSCIKSGHGRTFEFPDVYMKLEGYSARVIREWYTHIGGSPTRLQQSTRYIQYRDFEYVIPETVDKDPRQKKVYMNTMNSIREALNRLEGLGGAREDIALLLPLGMKSDIVCKHNLRNLSDMSRQRMCSRAYHEYRRLFSDVIKALADYSDEWKELVESDLFAPKCEVLDKCPEEKGCGKYPKEEQND